jgi:hypothetical protein
MQINKAIIPFITYERMRWALPSTNIPLDASGQHAIRVPFILPKDVAGAKSMRVMLLLDGLNPDKKVYVDTIGIYQLNGE